MNIYWLVNEEMKRLWEMFHAEKAIAYELQSRREDGYDAMLTPRIRHHDQNCQKIQATIEQFRTLMLESLKTNEPLIQEKIAELALTGTPDVQKDDGTT